MYNIRSCHRRGFQAEKDFLEQIAKTYRITKSTKEEDFFQHIDFFIEDLFDYTISLDLKSNIGNDVQSKPGFFIEIKNVRGNIGWIDGKADFIVVIYKGVYHFYPRIPLRDYLRGALKDKTVYPKRNPYNSYKIYNRNQEGKKDEIVFVPFKDIEHLIELCIKKES